MSNHRFLRKNRNKGKARLATLYSCWEERDVCFPGGNFCIFGWWAKLYTKSRKKPMTKEDLTYELLGKRIIHNVDSKKLVSWAVDILQLGFESENLFILAGLDNEDPEIREKYFFESIKDLNISLDKTDEELIDIYAERITTKVLNGEIEVEDGFKEMCVIASATSYDEKYLNFYMIEEDLDYLKYTTNVLYLGDLSLENSENYILEEFQIFQKMRSINIPKSEFEKYYCEQCDRLVSSKTKSKFRLTKPFKYEVLFCENCGSENLKYPQEQKTRKKLIEIYSR